MEFYFTMSFDDKQYSKLAPLSLSQRTDLARAAIEFFYPGNYEEKCTILGKVPDRNVIRPLAGTDFITYLEKKDVLKDAWAYWHQISSLLGKMVSTDILVALENSRDHNLAIPGSYYFLKHLTSLQKSGVFWLAPALGPDFLFHLVAPAIAQITGTNNKGDSAAGTGIAFHPHYILTCGHVVRDMDVDRQQAFQDSECTIVEEFVHQQVDVAVIQIDRPLKPVSGLAFLSPVIAQSVFTLGYPKIPCTRAPALTMQPGSVTSESVTTFKGDDLFLYSAISRPGNSGGPIVSSEGYIVGISSKDYLTGMIPPRMTRFHLTTRESLLTKSRRRLTTLELVPRFRLNALSDMSSEIL